EIGRRRRVPYYLRCRVDEVEQPSSDGGAVGARVELGGEVASGRVELRGQYEHSEAGLETDSAIGEANAHRDGDERHAARGGQLEHGAREERRPQRPHGRSAVTLVHGRDLLRLNTATVERAQRREAANDVGEMGREKRQRLPALASAPLRIPPDQ